MIILLCVAVLLVPGVAVFAAAAHDAKDELKYEHAFSATWWIAARACVSFVAVALVYLAAVAYVVGLAVGAV